MTLFTAEVKGNQLIELQTVEIDGSQWLNYRTARERLTYDNLKGLLDQVNEHLENQNEK
jgi:NADH pyrophosphatase NudC (nudix superfamily)